jgi:hypothetical protein
MLVMQEDGKLRSYGFALRRHCLIEEMILHLLGKLLHIRITASPNARLSCSVITLEVRSVGGMLATPARRAGWQYRQFFA